MTATSIARQKFLEDVVKIGQRQIGSLGYDVRDKVRISVGFPKGSHGGRKAIGQCWPNVASTDGYSEIFISPELQDTAAIIETIVHELVHHTVGCIWGHKGQFKKLAEELGFTAPMTTTPAGPVMQLFVKETMKKVGKYPAGALMVGNRKKQGTRLLKCQCQKCDYTVRTTRFWVEKAGSPICPTDKISMVCETVDSEEG